LMCREICPPAHNVAAFLHASVTGVWALIGRWLERPVGGK
jgi:hypothetical protein